MASLELGSARNRSGSSTSRVIFPYTLWYDSIVVVAVVVVVIVVVEVVVFVVTVSVTFVTLPSSVDKRRAVQVLGVPKLS